MCSHIYAQIDKGTRKKVSVWKTAGGGKTDFLALVTSIARANHKASLAVCLNTDARDEMYDRGLLSTLEANNWHALEKRNLEIKLGALLDYEHSEADPVNKYDKMRLVLEPCNVKSRLLLRAVLEKHFGEPLRVPMHKVFVEFVVQLVRAVSHCTLKLHGLCITCPVLIVFLMLLQAKLNALDNPLWTT